MNYYKGTKEQLENYNSMVSIGENYSGSTQRWSDVIEIAGLFYIAKNDKYINEELEVVNSLPTIEEDLI